MIRGFLSAKERGALRADGAPERSHGVARRANAVLLLDDGVSCAEVARVLYLDDDTVRTWFKRYRRAVWRYLISLGLRIGSLGADFVGLRR